MRSNFLSRICLLCGISLLMVAPHSDAGVYSDDLGKCLVSSSNEQDKTDLVRWVFANAALHPQVRQLSAIDEKQKQKIDQTAGTMIQRLLTEDCRILFRDALRNEGASSLEGAFAIFGQVAMQQLMANPAVTEGFASFDQYVSAEDLEAAVQEDKP